MFDESQEFDKSEKTINKCEADQVSYVQSNKQVIYGMVKSIGKSYLNFENDGLFATFNQPYNDPSYTVQSYDEHIYNSQLPLNDGVNCYDKNMSPGKLP